MPVSRPISWRDQDTTYQRRNLFKQSPSERRRREGAYYHYCELPPATVDGLMGAPSMGRFYNQNIIKVQVQMVLMIAGRIGCRTTNRCRKLKRWDGTMPNWVPGYLLANLDAKDTIENDYYALMSASDPRVVSIRAKHSQFDGLVSQFTDEFGVKIEPSVLMVREDAGRDVINVEAIAGFRDAIALSCICKARALRMIYRMPRHFQFSSWFDFYPWITGIDYSGIIGNSPALMAWHRAEEFRGQTTAGLPYTTLSLMDCDDALLNSLLGE